MRIAGVSFVGVNALLSICIELACIYRSKRGRGWDDAAVYKYCNIDLAWGRGAHAGVHDDVVGRHSKYYILL